MEGGTQSWKNNPPHFEHVLQPLKAEQVHSGFRPTEENVWSPGNARHTFIHRWVLHARCELRVTLGVVQAGSPNSLMYWMHSMVPESCITQRDLFMRAGSRSWEYFIGPSLKAMGILLILVAQTSGWGSLTDSVYPTEHYFKKRKQLQRIKGTSSLWKRFIKRNRINFRKFYILNMIQELIVCFGVTGVAAAWFLNFSKSPHQNRATI